MPCKILNYTFFKMVFSSVGIQKEVCRQVHTTNIYLLKVNDRSTGKKCTICSKLTVKRPERRHSYPSGVICVNFERILYLLLIFLLLNLSTECFAGICIYHLVFKRNMLSGNNSVYLRVLRCLFTYQK